MKLVYTVCHFKTTVLRQLILMSLSIWVSSIHFHSVDFSDLFLVFFLLTFCFFLYLSGYVLDFFISACLLTKYFKILCNVLRYIYIYLSFILSKI